MPDSKPVTLVVSAHAGDFVWRAGGAIAKATQRRERVVIVCMSYGERGESASQWLQGKSLEGDQGHTPVRGGKCRGGPGSRSRIP